MVSRNHRKINEKKKLWMKAKRARDSNEDRNVTRLTPLQRRVKARLLYQQNPEPKRKKMRLDYANNPDKKTYKVRQAYNANPAPKRASVRQAYIANPAPKRASVRQAYIANPSPKRASVRQAYIANPAPKRASVRQAYIANPAPKRASVRQAYIANPAPKRASVRQAYIANPAPKRASVRQAYIANPAPKRASVRQAYIANPAPKRASVNMAYARNPERARSRKRYSYRNNHAYASLKIAAVMKRYRTNKEHINARKKVVKVTKNITRRYIRLDTFRQSMSLKGSKELHIRSLALALKKSKNSDVNSRLEAERIIKWCFSVRVQYVKQYKKCVAQLKEKASISLARVAECASSTKQNKINALCGLSLHTVHTEPFFYNDTYKTFNNKSKVIIMNERGQAVNIFDPASTCRYPEGSDKIWSCNYDICNVQGENQLPMKRMETLLQKVSMLTPQRATSLVKSMTTCIRPNCQSFSRSHIRGHPISCHSYIGSCKSDLLFLRTLSPHFPEIRNMVRTLYSLRTAKNKLIKLDSALTHSHVTSLKHIADTAQGDGHATETTPHSLLESAILSTFKKAFQELTKRCVDTPKHDCISCEKLCYRRNVIELSKLRKPLTSVQWVRLLHFNSKRGVENSCYICQYCISKFRANQLPPTCVVNGLLVEPRPKEITELNNYETMLIQRAKAFQVVSRMGTVAGKNIPHRQMVPKVIGRTFHLPLPIEETLKKLPAPADPLSKHQELYIIVRGIPTRAKRVWEDLVDVNKVYAALKLLKATNMIYSHIQLPTIPEDLLNFIHPYEEVQFQVGSHEQNQSVVGNNEGDNNEHPAFLTQVDPLNAESAYQDLTIYPMYEARPNKSACELYQMLKVTEAPITVMDKQLDVKCFPDLFCNGKFGQMYLREVALSSADFIKSRLMSKHPHFRLNTQYLFYLLHDANIRQIKAGIFHKMNIVNQREGRLSAAACLEQISKEELEGSITTIFSRLRNSPQYWSKPRNDVECMTTNYGPATFFLTLSPCEYEWDNLAQYLREINGPEMANKSINELVALDPVSTSRFIDNQFHAMLSFLLAKDAPLGKILHYFWRREYQGRGIQHFHLLLWVDGAPILGSAPITDIGKFISKYITCGIPDTATSPVLHHRVTNFQSHRCNSYCMRNKKKKRGYVKVCRFGFPRPVTDALEVKGIDVAIAGRKMLRPNSRLYDLPRTRAADRINDYNAAVLLAWNGNMDIQFIGEKSAILNRYITKYATKAETTYTAQTFDDINSTKSLSNRLYNIGMRGLSHRECGALEASDTLLGISLYGTDTDTTIKWVDVNITRSRRLKPRNVVQGLPPNSTDIFFPSLVDDHYPERPDKLADISLFEFAAWYEITRTSPNAEKFEMYETANGMYLKKRSRACLINHYKYSVKEDPEKYFYSLLLLFKPWRDIGELKGNHDSFGASFQSCKDTLPGALKYHQKLTNVEDAAELVNQLVSDKIAEYEKEANNTDDGPENALAFTTIEAENAMQEFTDTAALADDEVESDIGDMINALNVDQKRVFDYVVHILMGDCTGPILRHFVSGTGGTGKSYLIKTIKSWVKLNLHKDVAVSAPTGIAAFNVNGLTIYRLLQLPVEHGFTPKYKELSDEALKVIRSNLKNVKLFIIDEISMVSNLTLMYVHLRMSEIFASKNCVDGWFGRKHVLLLGDLLQLPPVHESSPFVKLSLRDVEKYLGSLSVINLWQQLFTYDELLINMRQLNDSGFVDMLKRIRLGILTQDDIHILVSRKIPLSPAATTPQIRLKELSGFINTLPVNAVCLLPTRYLCSILNIAMLETLQSTEIKLVAEDTVDCPQYLQKKVRSLLIKHDDDSSRTAGLEKTIIIKVGAKVMLRRNIDVTLGLVNGAIGKVLSVTQSPRSSTFETITIEYSTGTTHELERSTSKFEVMDKAYVFRKQFPITLSYGITIHKSQGLSLTTAIIDIGSSVFTCGQAYVALSRVTQLQGIHLINFNPVEVKAQSSAILEYNRLRSVYRPDLCQLETSDKTSERLRVNDRIWAPNARADRVQQGTAPITTSKSTISKTSASKVSCKGFRNTNNVSCYANATLQSLLHYKPLRSLLASNNLNNELQSLAEIHSSGFAEMDATNIRLLLGGVFQLHEQQDASEFLTSLLEKSDDIKQTIQYSQRSETRCLVCGYNSSIETPGYILRMFVPENPKHRSTSIQAMYDLATGWTSLCYYNCPECNGTNARQRLQVVYTGSLLVLQFMLFEGESKITDLKLPGIPTASLKVNGNIYKPMSAVFHHGDSATSGHYTAYLRDGTSWTCANDLEVKKQKWPLLGKNIYLLILQK